jgi:osmotically inducible protein OsmC
LLAVAHASSYIMTLAEQLGHTGAAAGASWRLDVGAVVRLERTDAGWRVRSSRLAVRAMIPGLDGARFRAFVNAATEACPLTQALRGNVEVSVDGTLAG